MNILALKKHLKSNPYWGRGIIVGKSNNGMNAVMAYFIMGRSENSRNRVFIEDGSGIKIEAFDPSKLSDPSLIIYSPVKTLDDKTIVTNGDQTDTVYEFIKSGKTFEDALSTRCFEPDAPNFTPRISAIINIDTNKFSYKLNILKSADKSGSACNRFTFDYSSSLKGTGHFIHTYMGDQNPLPSFSGEPTPVAIPDNIDDFTRDIWTSLNNDNKVSLFVRFINLENGEKVSKIINKNI